MFAHCIAYKSNILTTSSSFAFVSQTIMTSPLAPKLQISSTRDQRLIKATLKGFFAIHHLGQQVLKWAHMPFHI